MSDLSTCVSSHAARSQSLERNRQRIDDLNVYPVPDGDTGTNLTLTARSVVDQLEQTDTEDRPGLVKEVTRAALMGARGNSGVILSQIIRGAAEVLGSEAAIDARVVAHAFQAARDAAYRAVREPVEGTMLSVIRETGGGERERRRRRTSRSCSPGSSGAGRRPSRARPNSSPSSARRESSTPAERVCSRSCAASLRLSPAKACPTRRSNAKS